MVKRSELEAAIKERFSDMKNDKIAVGDGDWSGHKNILRNDAISIETFAPEPTTSPEGVYSGEYDIYGIIVRGKEIGKYAELPFFTDLVTELIGDIGAELNYQEGATKDEKTDKKIPQVEIYKNILRLSTMKNYEIIDIMKEIDAFEEKQNYVLDELEGAKNNILMIYPHHRRMSGK